MASYLISPLADTIPTVADVEDGALLLTTVDQSKYVFAGTDIPDPISLILAYPDAADRDNIVRAWVRSEFNLPRSLRSLCDNSFLRVLTHAQYAICIASADGYARLGERRYELYEQSSKVVLATAPLIAVSFRTFEGEAYAVAHVWAAKQANGKGF